MELDGAPVMIGSEHGNLKLLRKALAPNAIPTCRAARRSRLTGRDMERDPAVKAVKQFLISVSRDMSRSAQLSQQRLQAERSKY
jgi:hypothetical protein